MTRQHPAAPQLPFAPLSYEGLRHHEDRYARRIANRVACGMEQSPEQLAAYVALRDAVETRLGSL